MAKIAPKGKKVNGTKKKDKITWVSSKLWKKNLTVKAGAGNDVINFKKSKYKNTIYGEAGNDKIYGGKGADKIYGGKGNDYIDGGAGNDKIYGNYGKNTLKGGAGNDYIYGGTGADKIYTGAGIDTVYGGAGNDVIHVQSDYSHSHLGKGNDTVSIDKGIFSWANIYFEKGDGNNTLKGIEKIPDSANYSIVELQSNSLLRDVKSVVDNTTYFSYIMAERSGSNLVLKLTSGETFTIQNYYNLSQMQKNRISFNGYESSFESMIYASGDIITLTGDEDTYVSNSAHKLILAQNIECSGKGIGTEADYNTLVLEGGGYQSAEIWSDNCSAYINNTDNSGTNNVYIAGDYNYIVMSGKHNQNVYIEDGLTNYIRVNGGKGSITTSRGGKTSIVLNSDSEGSSYINLSGSEDSINIIRGADTRIDLYNNSSNNAKRYISTDGHYANHITLRNAAATKETTLSLGVTAEPTDIMFSHYETSRNESGEDYINILVQKGDGTVFKNVSDVKIYGSWNGSIFNLDTDDMKNKIKARAYYYDDKNNFIDTDYKNFGDMTQFVDMNSDQIDQNTYGDGNTHKLYAMGDGVLNIAKDVYVQGTNGYDDYSFTTIGKKHTISDAGGEDWLTINQEASEGDFRFYFDVILDGDSYKFGNDLYVVSTAGSDYNDTDLYQLFKGEDVNYLCIKDFFGNDNGIFGTGCIETIEDAGGNQVDYEALAGQIAENVVSWLQGTNYSSVSEIIEAGGNSDQAQALFSLYWAEDSWNGLW